MSRLPRPRQVLDLISKIADVAVGAYGEGVRAASRVSDVIRAGTAKEAFQRLGAHFSTLAEMGRVDSTLPSSEHGKTVLEEILHDIESKPADPGRLAAMRRLFLALGSVDTPHDVVQERYAVRRILALTADQLTLLQTAWATRDETNAISTDGGWFRFAAERSGIGFEQAIDELDLQLTSCGMFTKGQYSDNSGRYPRDGRSRLTVLGIFACQLLATGDELERMAESADS